jgi:hypothetical protein
MNAFGEAWNGEPDLGDALAKIGFNSVIGYGMQGEAAPRGYIDVQNGKVVASGAYSGQDLNWDLRASEDDWNKWCDKGLGMMALGMAYTRGKLKFQIGDYGAMIKNPAMAGPFIKSFTVMGSVPRG